MRELKLRGLLLVTNVAYIMARAAHRVSDMAVRMSDWAERAATRVCE
jgi:hypothetical protein